MSAFEELQPDLNFSMARRCELPSMRGQRTEDDPDFYPLRVIYGAGYPRGCVSARVFPGSVHL
jgi:hypothetical protein